MHTYFLKRTLVVLLFLLLLVPLSYRITGVEIADFTEEDCNCPGLGMDLKYAHAQWNEMFTARYEKSRACTSRNTTLSFSVWANYITPEIATNNFNTKVDTLRENTYSDIKNKSYTDEDIVIHEELFTDERVSFMYGDYSGAGWNSYLDCENPPRYTGYRYIKYRDIFIISMSGEYFESGTDIANAFSAVESCTKAVIDSKLGEESETKILTGRISCFDDVSSTYIIPMRHMQLVLHDGNKVMETTTNASGKYNFTLQDYTTGKEYILDIKFAYEKNHTTFFRLFYQDEESPVVLSQMFTLNTDEDLTHNIIADQDLMPDYGGAWAKAFASMYVHFSEAIDAYTFLDVNINYQLPLDVYTFVPKETGTRYWYNIPGKSYITIDTEKSIHESVYRPMNREYHEFSHYIMHTLYKKWPAPATDLPVSIEERNHDGYLNPSTSDSYVEGFAIYMSAILFAFWEDVGVTVPMSTPDPESMSLLEAENFMYATHWQGLELGAKAYGNSGKAEERAIASVLWDLMDGNDVYCDKSPEEMYQEYLRRLPEIKRVYEYYKTQYEEVQRDYGITGPNATAPPLKNYTLDDFKAMQWDDDQVSLGVGAVWNVTKEFHNDFTSVYNEFIARYPEQKQEIDKVFIDEGFYVDTNPGNGICDHRDIYRDENNNGQYDEGEYYVDFPVDGFEYTPGNVVGQAANYNRQWRQSVQEVPGYFIKVDNTVPFYLIKVSFPYNFYLDYVVRSWNDNGLVSIPVPPEGYHALISVIPEGVECNGPLNFTSIAFHHDYNASLAQGYYLSYDFQVTGPIPPYPSMPSDTDDNGPSPIPGFECIIIIGLLSVMLLWRRYRKQ
jgi:hypothetical protein